MADKRKGAPKPGARRPPAPKASKSGSGFHSAAKYSKRERRAGKRPPREK